jgi:ornithine--oxo-acid transaminase
MVGERFKVVPMNSGVEACESAVKLARKWGYLHKKIPQNQVKVLFPNNNYWGRTISAISTSDYSYQKHFYPATPGFLKVPYNDPVALEEMLVNDPTISAVFMEPVQGEGGINVPDNNYFKNVRALCTKHNVLLICDEIQTGMGRTGTGLCIESYGIQADMILLGKSLGGGFVPVSVCMARSDIADLFLPGEHSSTFGGFPLGCAMGTASVRLLHETNLLEKVMIRERQLFSELQALQKQFPHRIESIRGKGMLFGIQLSPSLLPFDVVTKLVDYGIVTREANHHVVRICPPLNVTDSEMEWLFNRLRTCFSEM